MNRRMQAVTGLMWLALPLTALRYWWVWDRLPARMATHFNAAGQANGWMTREVALEYGLGLTAFVLLIFTIMSYVMQKQKAPAPVAWSLTGLLALVVGMIYQANNGIIAYNLTGRPVSVFGPLILVPAVIVFTTVYLGSKRGSPLPESAPLAEETHASLMMGFIFLILLGIELAIATQVPGKAVFIPSIMLALVFAACAAFAWSGFHYRFTQGGVEIRALGFRLRSIPAAEIREYTVESWSLLRGYGIRGIGASRAYVLGNQVVHIRTAEGDVFLGHDEPQRVVRDLDMMRQLVQ